MSLVKERFIYENGKLIYRHNTKRMLAGQEAGSLHHSGYVQIYINSKSYQRSRLIWEYHNGPIPEGFEVDHINAIRNDDRIENLQLIAHSDNVAKGGIQTGRSHNKSGYTGVFWCKSHGKWQAGITVNGQYRYLGLFETPEQANVARKNFESNLLKEVDYRIANYYS